MLAAGELLWFVLTANTEPGKTSGWSGLRNRTENFCASLTKGQAVFLDNWLMDDTGMPCSLKWPSRKDNSFERVFDDFKR